MAFETKNRLSPAVGRSYSVEHIAILTFKLCGADGIYGRGNYVTWIFRFRVRVWLEFDNCSKILFKWTYYCKTVDAKWNKFLLANIVRSTIELSMTPRMYLNTALLISTHTLILQCNNYAAANLYNRWCSTQKHLLYHCHCTRSHHVSFGRSNERSESLTLFSNTKLLNGLILRKWWYGECDTITL